MTSSGDEVFLLQCTLCGAKFSQTGTVVGGSRSCNPHQYGPLAAAAPVEAPPKSSTSPRAGIVYPSDAERNWLRLVDENKNETEQHSKKLTDDIVLLSDNKSEALEAIHEKIQTLKQALDDRQDELEKALNEAYKERHDKTKANIELLKAHRKKNIEAKDDSEDLLIGNKKVDDREKTIVTNCQEVLQSTPNIKYIETELRYSFDELEHVQRRLSKFGTLHCKPVNAGIKCIFQSVLDARNLAATPKAKAVDLPELQLRNTAYDESKQRVKLGFRLRDNDGQNGDIDLKIRDHIHIHVLCSQEMDDDGKQEELQPIHEENVALKDCKLSANKKKYELYVKHKFTPGITVEFKIRPKFVSPEEEKYASCQGSWSREQTAEIPEDDDNKVFNLEFNGRKKSLTLIADDSALTNFSRFEKKFIKKFSINLKQNEKLMLRTKHGVELNAKTKLSTFASNEYVIEGEITDKPPPKAYSGGPQMMSANEVADIASNRNRIQSTQAEVFISPRVGVSGNGNNVRSPRENKKANAKQAKKEKKEKKKPSGDNLKAGPRQIASIAKFTYKGAETKKRVVLKNNPKKNLYEYEMDTLKDKVLKKFEKSGLKGAFALKTDDGNVIQTDEHILEYLTNYKGEITVVPQ